ncbi:MAG: phage tail tape measure protein [Roseibium sp.]
MATLTSQLIVSMLERVSSPARIVSKSLTQMKLRADANARAMGAMRGRMLDAVGVGYLLAKSISAPINAAREFEGVMAEVNKVVDFETPGGLANMSKDILALSREIPVAATGIAEIVAAAGQAGMAGDELLQFAEMAAKVGVAFDISADQTGESLAKIKTALGITVEQTSELADVLNHLSNTSASSATDLLQFMRRVGSTGIQMGFSARETAAIGSAMVAAGAQADVASTSFRNMAKALARGESASARQNKAFKKLGLNAKAVAKTLQKDAVGTMNDVIARIRDLPKEVQASTISDLFGDEARAIMPLILNADLLTNALGQVADHTNYLGSATKEFEVRAQTFDARLQGFKNRMTELAITIGNALLPALSRIMEAIMPLVTAVADLASAYPQVIAAVVGVSAALLALNVAAIASRFAFRFLKGGVLSAGLTVERGANLIVAATKRMRLAVLGGSMLGAVGGGTIFSILASSATVAVAGIQTAATAIGAAVLGMTWPIAAVIAAVAGLGLAVYRYWEPIREFVGGFAEVVGAGLSAAMTAINGFASDISAVVSAWSTDRLVDIGTMLGLDEAAIRSTLAAARAAIASTLTAIVDLVLAIPARLGDWISDIFSMKDYSSQAEAGFRDAGRRAGQAMVDAIIEAFNQFWEFLRSIPGRIKSAIGKIDIGSLISMPSFLGGGTPAPAKAAIDGARAAGGPIVGGRTYLTGEMGAELITPNRSGYVHDAKSTQAALTSGAGAEASPSLSIQIGDIVIQGAVNAREIAEQIGAEIKSELAGLQADSSWSVA